MTFEELMDTIPQHIQLKKESVCNRCGHKHTVTRNYNLKIDILELDKSFDEETGKYTRGKRYRVYYEYDRFRVIGENTGMGKATIEEAVEELKKYLFEENVREMEKEKNNSILEKQC